MKFNESMAWLDSVVWPIWICRRIRSFEWKVSKDFSSWRDSIWHRTKFVLSKDYSHWSKMKTKDDDLLLLHWVCLGNYAGWICLTIELNIYEVFKIFGETNSTYELCNCTETKSSKSKFVWFLFNWTFVQFIGGSARQRQRSSQIGTSHMQRKSSSAK